MQRDRSFGSLTRLIAGAALADDVRLSQFCAAKRPRWNGPQKIRENREGGRDGGFIRSVAPSAYHGAYHDAYRTGIAGAFAGAGHRREGARCAVRPGSACGKPESRREGRGRQGAGRAIGRRATSPAAGFHHQADRRTSRPHARLHRDRGLDPPVRRQGRAAGRYRLYRLSARWRRRRDPAGDLPVQRRAGRGLGLSATRRCRTVAAADHRAMRDFLPPRPICSPTPRPGSTSPISSSSIPSAPATAVSSRAARTCASASSRSTATSTRSRS